MSQEIQGVIAKISVPDDVSEIGRTALEEKWNNGLLEAIMKIILHAMVDDAYYVDLKMLCEANIVDPMDGQKASIRATFLAKHWECSMLGRIGHASPLGRAHVLADCHGMTLSEYLTQCLHCGPAVMAKNAKDPDAQDFPDAFP